jgi:hypothetical protein
MFVLLVPENFAAANSTPRRLMRIKVLSKTKPAADPFGLRPVLVNSSLRLLLHPLLSCAHALHPGRSAKGEAVAKREAVSKSARIDGGSHGLSNL